MQLCKNCKFCGRSRRSLNLVCKKEVYRVDPIDGYKSHLTCDYRRKSEDGCGDTCADYERKLSLIEKIGELFGIIGL